MSIERKRSQVTTKFFAQFIWVSMTFCDQKIKVLKISREALRVYPRKKGLYPHKQAYKCIHSLHVDTLTEQSEYLDKCITNKFSIAYVCVLRGETEVRPSNPTSIKNVH